MGFMQVSVVGLGYIGTPTAVILAQNNINVIGVDVSQKVVDTINAGELHIVEPGLGSVLKHVVEKGTLRATTKPEPADVFIITVPTPFTAGHRPDLSYIKAATQSVAPVLKKGDLVILESTSPVGTTEQLADWLGEARPDISFPQQAGENADVQIAYCPERVLPGKILQELVNNDRVVGGMSAKASDMATALYRIFVEGTIAITNARTAEMCKLTENSFRDVNIAFANELSMICDKLNVNVWELIRLANRHPRVKILQPGCGVGGHCIAVDPWFIVSSTPDLARLVSTARQVNDHKPGWVIEKVLAARDEILAAAPSRKESDLSVAVLGLTFKPDIDDMRESPALAITIRLAEETSMSIKVVEPNISRRPQVLAGLSLFPLELALKNADIILILVAHKEFRGIKPLKSSQKFLDCVGLSKV